MPDESSQNLQSPRGSAATDGEVRTGVLALRVVVVHSFLLVATPLVQSLATIGGGWIDAIPLLIVFIAGPILGIILYRAGQERPGSIILLSFMSASVYTNLRILLPALDADKGSVDASTMTVPIGILLAGLVAAGVMGTLLALALLRRVHSVQPSSESTDNP